MSRGKFRTNDCADCGVADPAWASINRGILVCDECCSIHRSLGRHISQIRSLKKGTWNSVLLAMVRTLYSNGANSIWEHSLLDPTTSKSGRQKPGPKDPVHPTKADFIRAKHQMLSFVYRPGKDDRTALEGDFSKQLHSSVRTSNLQTSLRLISLGADPNYYHPERGNCPLHVAVRSSQGLQVELLVVYGADPAAVDSEGKTPADYARLAGNVPLHDRLLEMQYELPDRLTYFLCGRSPDHGSGQHFIIPEMADGLDMSEYAKAARTKLQALSNEVFEELAMDVFDEVDRRETDSVWMSMQSQSALVADRCTVPFLPVNPQFSSTRNQGRQKLARFSAREFATLLIDVLAEIRRRQGVVQSQKDDATQLLVSNHISGSLQRGTSLTVPDQDARKSDISDDEPLYDSVASDEDYVLLENHMGKHEIVKVKDLHHDTKTMSGDSEKSDASQASSGSPRHKYTKSRQSSEGEQIQSTSTSIQDSASSNTLSIRSVSEFEEVSKQLATSEAKIMELTVHNDHMKDEINKLQSMVSQLMHENSSLKNTHQFSVPSMNPELHNGDDPLDTEPEIPLFGSPNRAPVTVRGQRPVSMFEPREGYRRQHQHGTTDLYGNAGSEEVHLSQPYPVPATSHVYRLPHSHFPYVGSGDQHPPTQDEVIKKTEQITKRIQELLISAQETKHERFIPCSEKIHAAVAGMTELFVKVSVNTSVRSCLQQLSSSADRLLTRCQTLLSCPAIDLDYQFVTQQVIQCAYDIAKAAKVLVTLFQ